MGGGGGAKLVMLFLHIIWMEAFAEMKNVMQKLMLRTFLDIHSAIWTGLSYVALVAVEHVRTLSHEYVCGTTNRSATELNHFPWAFLWCLSVFE